MESVFLAVFFHPTAPPATPPATPPAPTLDVSPVDGLEAALASVPPDVGDVVAPGVDAAGADLQSVRVEALLLGGADEEQPEQFHYALQSLAKVATLSLQTCIRPA